jgi:hypothetical protein
MSQEQLRDPSLRLRPWASLLLFLSAYSPLMLILIIKDYDAISPGLLPQNPVFSGILLLVAVFSSFAVLRSVSKIDSGLTVTVTKASNKSGDMFGYTIPYMLSFMKVDLGDWQVLVSLALFLSILFIMAYRTQTVFVNPILALAGYMLIDSTFKRGDKEIQAMVVTRQPLAMGDTCRMERLSHYLYVAVKDNARPNKKSTQ